MICKKLISIIFLSLIIFNYSNAEETVFNYSPDSTYNESGRITGNVGKIDVSAIIEEAKNLCKELGFDPQSEEFTKCGLELAETVSGFDMARNQEYLLSKKIQSKENLSMSFSYDSKSGVKMNKESKWTKFWQGAAWIMYEHGDDIFKVILDLKYDTNYSGYNTKEKVSNTRSGLRCTGQRVGDMIYENCTGGGVFLRCTTTIIGQMAKRRCREV